MNDIYGKAVFAVLMQGGIGIAGKAPGYMQEKWDAIVLMQHPENLLDSSNLAVFKAWKETWKAHLIEE